MMTKEELLKALKAGEWNDIQFWNPGDVFGDDTRLLEPGEKEVRNPGIIAAMRRIAMCEQAGTGMRMMREEWQGLGHPAPTMKNDRAWKAFELFIPELDKEVDMASDLMKAMFSGASQVTDQVGTKSAPSQHQVTGEVTPPVTPPVERLIEVLGEHGELGAADIREKLGLKDRAHVREAYLNPSSG